MKYEYKYLRDKEKRIARKKKTVFIFQIMFFVILIVVFLSIGVFLFYKKITSTSSFTSSDDIPEILKNEKAEPSVPSSNLKDKIESNDNKKEKELKESQEENLSERNFSEWNKNAPLELKIVNKSNSLPEGYDLEESSLKKCENGKKVSSYIYDDLMDMIKGAGKDGKKLWVCSGYRSYSYQKNLFDKQVEREQKNEKNRENAIKKAKKTVAFPGQSEHNLGLAVDMNSAENGFENTDAYKWLSKNAYKYGFIERYKGDKIKHTGVVYEPWHYRYVGRKYAKLINDSGLCLEEYVANEMSDNNKLCKKS